MLLAPIIDLLKLNPCKIIANQLTIPPLGSNILLSLAGSYQAIVRRSQ